MDKLLTDADLDIAISKGLIKSIDSCMGEYYISNIGIVYSRKIYKNGVKIKRIKSVRSGTGYYHVPIVLDGVRKNKYIHKLLAEAFIPNPNGYRYVNHKNEVKGDDRLENLEWCTQKYNLNYGTCQMKKSKKVRQMTLDGVEVKVWSSLSEADRNGYINDYISRCARGFTRSYKKFRWEFV